MAENKFKEILNKIKAAFDAPIVPAAPAADTEPLATANVVSYPVDGGVPAFTDISDDGVPGIDANDALFTDEALMMPYPDGNYNVTGTTFGFTVAAGMVASVVDAAGTGAGTPIPDEAEPLTAGDVQPMPTVEERLAAIEAELAKAKIPVAPAMPTGMATEIALAATTQKFEAVTAKNEATIKELFELVEQLCATPSADPKTLTGNKKDQFDRTNKREKSLDGIAAAIKEMKTKK